MPIRLIHSQVGLGAIVVDDIDDGLPNKTAHRLGSNGDPKAYDRDGYANSPKQPCYIPRAKSSDPTVAGYIDLDLTDRVTLSVGKGKISKLQLAGLISTLVFNWSDLAAPTLVTADLDTPGAGDLTLTGTNLLSVAPEITTVTVATTNAFAVLAGSVSPNGDVRYVAATAGSSGTSITVTHVVAGLSTPLSVSVLGNAITVNVATDGGGLATSTATAVAAAVTAFPAAAALVTATALGTGLGVVQAVAPTALTLPSTYTLTQAQIVAGSGTVGNTSIVIPAALIAGVGTVVTTARVRADAQNTSAVALS